AIPGSRDDSTRGEGTHASAASAKATRRPTLSRLQQKNRGGQMILAARSSPISELLVAPVSSALIVVVVAVRHLVAAFVPAAVVVIGHVAVATVVAPRVVGPVAIVAGTHVVPAVVVAIVAAILEAIAIAIVAVGETARARVMVSPVAGRHRVDDARHGARGDDE